MLDYNWSGKASLKKIGTKGDLTRGSCDGKCSVTKKRNPGN